MKITKKFISAAVIMVLITGLCGCRKKEKDLENTLDKLKDTAWLREKFEENGVEKSADVPPYWIQFEGADHYTSILSTGEYTINNETGKLVFKGDATEYAVTVTGDKMVWEYDTKKETFEKLPKADPKLLVNNGKWWISKEHQKFDLTDGKWELYPVGMSPRLQFKNETSGRYMFGPLPSQDFTYTQIGNVLTGSYFSTKTIIIELTERKLEYIAINEEEEDLYMKIKYENTP